MHRTVPPMNPQHQADLRLIFRVLLALAVLAAFVLGIHFIA